MFVHECYSPEYKTSFYPRATGNMGGFGRTAGTWVKLQDTLYMSEERQRDQIKLRKPKVQLKIENWTLKSQINKMFHCSTSLCPRKRYRRLNSADKTVTKRPCETQKQTCVKQLRHFRPRAARTTTPVQKRPAENQSHNNYLNQVWQKRKTLNLSGFLSSSSDPREGDPPQETAFSQRSTVSLWATPLSGPLCFWSQTPAEKTGPREHFCIKYQRCEFQVHLRDEQNHWKSKWLELQTHEKQKTVLLMLKRWSSPTLDSWTVCTSLFLLPAYIMCCSGLQPAGNTYINHREAGHMQKHAGWRFLTYWTGEDEAEWVGDASVIVLVLVTVDDERVGC